MDFAGLPGYVVIVIPSAAVAALIGSYFYAKRRKGKPDNRRK